MICWPIRSFTPDAPNAVTTIEALITIFKAAVHQGTETDYTAEQQHAWAPETIDRQQWYVRLEINPTWIAYTLDHQPIGFIELAIDTTQDPPAGHIDMLYVRPDFHRQGIARALLTQAETYAHQHSCATLTTEASITARPFFEHAGFQVICEQTVHRHGQSLINYRMHKVI